MSQESIKAGKNVLGTQLEMCCTVSMTGFYRDGCCRTGLDDLGLHVVCIEVTADFLKFSLQVGNDLSTPIPEYGFPGLNSGDRWCLCAQRWQQALEMGQAPQVVLEATHISAIEFIDLEDLQDHAI
ncbi:MAG: DUF2237 domain-containing protein [Pirellulales bacterium]